MSTGKRLAKRSIIGTRVCAPGNDGKYYSGVIHDVKTPATFPENNNCINLTPNTRYSVRFDSKTAVGKPNSREYREQELIGPGFRSISGVFLLPGQTVFLTYNGRESSGEVLHHSPEKDEVIVQIESGLEGPLELRKRLDEVRLLESRKSARLMDQDTDFARLADMAGDRKRMSSHTIDVPAPSLSGSRKRRPSSSQDDFKDDSMDECNAALVLMSLSCSPHSPHGAWGGRLGSSPGGSSSTSWRSGTPSPPLSDNGIGGAALSNSTSASDEGIAMDYGDEMPRKKRASKLVFQCTWPGCGSTAVTCSAIESHVRNAHLGPKTSSNHSDGEGFESDHEEEFYYTEVECHRAGPTPPSPPTLSHRDMARPPHEDPEYQRQIVGSFRQGLLTLGQPINIPGSLQHPWAANHTLNSPQKHNRLSPRPSTSYAPYPSPCPPSPGVLSGHHAVHTFMSHSAPSKAPAPLSPSRRMRGENKKCRKVYGMEHREMWCTQCKWKKACSRFGD